MCFPHPARPQRFPDITICVCPHIHVSSYYNMCTHTTIYLKYTTCVFAARWWPSKVCNVCVGCSREREDTLRKSEYGVCVYVCVCVCVVRCGGSGETLKSSSCTRDGRDEERDKDKERERERERRKERVRETVLAT
jgi:hypothetical protein